MKRSCSITGDSEFFLLTKRLSGLGEMGLLVLPCEAYRYTLLTKWRSRWVNIDHVLVCVFIDRDDVGVNKKAKRTRAKWAHLARLGSQSELRSDFILPARGFSHIVKYYIP